MRQKLCLENRKIKTLMLIHLKLLFSSDVITKDSISFPLADISALGASFSSVASISALAGKGESINCTMDDIDINEIMQK